MDEYYKDLMKKLNDKVKRESDEELKEITGDMAKTCSDATKNLLVLVSAAHQVDKKIAAKILSSAVTAISLFVTKNPDEAIAFYTEVWKGCNEIFKKIDKELGKVM